MSKSERLQFCAPAILAADVLTVSPRPLLFLPGIASSDNELANNLLKAGLSASVAQLHQHIQSYSAANSQVSTQKNQCACACACAHDRVIYQR